MKPIILLASAVVGISVSAAAQELPVINPAEWSRPNVMVEGMRNQSRTPPARASANDAANTCAQLPQFRQRWGSRDPRVVKLAALCKQAGYR